MTASELFDLARGTPLEQGRLAEMARRLPEDDVIAEAMGLALADANGPAVTVLFATALGSGRRVDPRHLEDGIRLVPPYLHPPFLTRLGPDAIPAFLAVIRRHPLSADDAVATLLAAALVCRERREPLPDGFVAVARQNCRIAKSLDAALPVLLAHVMGDEGVFQALDLKGRPDEKSASALDRMASCFQEGVSVDLFALAAQVAPAMEPTVSATVRRAVARVGRNDPCRCGSGRKYKRCCFERDQERLRDSSDVPGVTRTELRRDVTPYLTPARIHAMSAVELVHVARKPLAEDLSQLVLARLQRLGELDAFAGRLEMVGYREELDPLIADAIGSAAGRHDRELVRRLVRLRGGRIDGVYAPIAARMLFEEPPRAALDLVEREATSVLRQRGDRSPCWRVGVYEEVDLAYDVLRVAPALGIFVARGVLNDAVGLDAEMLLEQLLEARDDLGLTAHDPAERLVRARLEFDDEPTGPARDEGNGEEWAAVQAELGEKTAQMRLLREEASRLRRELDGANTRAEALAATQAAASTAEPTADPEQVADLRRRLRNLSAELNERHDEQGRLRREVERLRREATSEPNAPSRTAAAALAEEADRAVLEGVPELGVQPVRLPRFAAAFSEAIDRLPSAVARAAMVRIGQLAAGDAEAFRGARSLSSQREVWRIRIGIGHRLLFRREPRTLEVLALVSRQDFDRAIKALAVSRPPR